jgi:hypothetical protein
LLCCLPQRWYLSCIGVCYINIAGTIYRGVANPRVNQPEKLLLPLFQRIRRTCISIRTLTEKLRNKILNIL